MVSIVSPEPDRKTIQPCDTWTDEIRRQAWLAVEIAATRREEADRALGYYLRAALSHGLTVADVCIAGDLDEQTVMRLTDPAVTG